MKKKVGAKKMMKSYSQLEKEEHSKSAKVRKKAQAEEAKKLAKARKKK
jgi:hypothetical protein